MASPAKDVIQNWLKANPMVFRSRLDQDVFTLIEFASGKELSLDTSKITQHRLTPHAQGFGDYLNLVLESGVELVLCHAGFAFSPSFNSTGPLPDAPPVACMMDYYTLYNNLVDLMSDEARKREALLLFNVMISVLDGARQIGLDVGREEEQLDAKLQEFEKGFTTTT